MSKQVSKWSLGAQCVGWASRLRLSSHEAVHSLAPTPEDLRRVCRSRSKG